ncbi:MAG: helix-turn-helix domain-containing protein [Bacteroidetes bacterium]|nr:helix-turn-helix domain-containing protein [Bacteroidota bacterium]
MTPLHHTAAQFINTTSGHIFLTGKAGTGKTTFLKSLGEITHKNFIVVAPTGIAALNAGGVTIHSQFLLPPANFIPGRNHHPGLHEDGVFVDQHLLARKHPLNAARRNVLRSIDLLVIDEVSMLRADLLDAVDYRMKSVRNNFRDNFGGVQVLFIGDLHQLPPVVKPDDWRVLSQYYKTPWFYEALALKDQPPVYIELDTIFRQKDDEFISILNHLRNNETTAADIERLNRQVRSAEEIRKLREVITLTTHNQKADEINLAELRALRTPSSRFEALIEGEFPGNMYPVLPQLELKIGAQIMFVRNDSSEDKAYFNGKLATVSDISDDDIHVSFDTGATYKLKREKWENKKYKLNEGSNDLEEEILGSFQQYPVKLAWAITVHKSQGLTFDRAIIDVGQAFAEGQVYVALSRLRSLDGLVLRTPIESHVIRTDKAVIAFAQTHHRPHDLESVMRERQKDFVAQLAEQTFDFTFILKQLSKLEHEWGAEALRESDSPSIFKSIRELITKEESNTWKFRQQLHHLIQARQEEQLLERLEKGSVYYKVLLAGQLRLLLTHEESLQDVKGVRGYMSDLSELDVMLDRKVIELERVTRLVRAVLAGDGKLDFSEIEKAHRLERMQWIAEIRKESAHVPVKPKRGRKSKKSGKGGPEEPSTQELSLQMFLKGLTIEQIAAERQLARSTIESHFAKLTELGRMQLSDFMSEDSIHEIEEAIKQLPEGHTMKDVFSLMKGKYGYGLIRAVMSMREAKGASFTVQKSEG